MASLSGGICDYFVFVHVVVYADVCVIALVLSAMEAPVTYPPTKTKTWHTRQCGGCTLCCKLLPVRELHKQANERCKHQRHGVGCSIYARRPLSCRAWSCAWLLMPDITADLHRPDRSHFVIDGMPDIVIMHDEGREPVQRLAFQIWVDPRHREAWRDPKLLAMIDKAKKPAIVRYSAETGFVMVPPSLMLDHKWFFDMSNPIHREDEIFDMQPKGKLWKPSIDPENIEGNSD